MSTFLGLMEEIPGISIDCFDGDNLNSSAFFLSHCHSDHMKGLSNDFFKHLESKNKFFYCSHLSKSFLKSRFSQLDEDFWDKHLIDLPCDESKMINYSHNDTEFNVTVLCISSGHCPGAVMFLFNYSDQNILYTGDFRINKGDFSKLNALHYGDNIRRVPLNIEKIYLDTTFLNLDFQVFPSRVDSSKALCTAVKDWIEKDPKNVVILEISALIGSEFIYMELFKMLNRKIHVKDKVYEIYSRMEILANCVTDVGENARIHACTNKTFKKTLGLKCRADVDHKNILTIIPSVQKWARKDTSCIIEWDKNRKQTKNVCYSTHASYSELEAFIKYFKPKDVYPCVYHENDKTTIDKLLRNIMLQPENNQSTSKPVKLSFSNYKMFKKQNKRSKLISDDEDDV